MKKAELLAPAGNYEAFIGAINAGCDAVYLGGNKFGARAYADNFTDDEIIQAIEYAHILQVKVYLTVNTLMKEREIEEAIHYIEPFYLAGLDAVIVQDLGLANDIIKIFPDMECHISTQAAITGVEAARYFHQMGAKRIVLARELTLQEIKEIKNDVPIELETFIHGAMCYSVSGQCLFSSVLGGRSGNRGRCAGPCRLPYQIGNNGKYTEEHYYLSMKDQCTLSILPELLSAGIDSLKIEGRMKKPEYAAFVTSVYRKYIDMYYSNSSKYEVAPEDINDIRQMYIRSEIGTGYYEKSNGKDMISIENPAYIGANDDLMATVRERFLENRKQVAVQARITFYKNQPMNLRLQLAENEVEVKGIEVQEAVSKPIDDSEIRKQLNKTKDTPFYMENICIDGDKDGFVPLKALNALRREGIAKLIDSYRITRSINEDEKKLFEERREHTKPINNGKYEIMLSVMSEEQLLAIEPFSSKIWAVTVTSEDLLKESTVLSRIKRAGCRIFVSLPSLLRNRDIHELESQLQKAIEMNICDAVVVKNVESLQFIKRVGIDHIIADGTLYAWNQDASRLLMSDVDFICIPYELSNYERQEVINEHFIETAYTRIPLMVTANCAAKTSNMCEKNKGHRFATIKDRKNIEMPVYFNCDYCYNVIYNSVPTSLHKAVEEGKLLTNRIRLEFTIESGMLVEQIVQYYLNISNGKMTTFPLKEYTNGYFKRGVE